MPMVLGLPQEERHKFTGSAHKSVENVGKTLPKP